MSADRHSEYGKVAQAVIDNRVSIEDQRRILCYLIGYLEGDDEFRAAFTKEVNFYLQPPSGVRA
jgi:hypothetical protein